MTTALDAAIRRLRAGHVQGMSTSEIELADLEFVRVVVAAERAWADQLERVDQFSLPLQSEGRTPADRARASTTAQLFLAQLVSDFRRVATPSLDLASVESRRTSPEGSAALLAAGVEQSRPLAPLAVGQYLAVSEHRGPTFDESLRRITEEWLLRVSPQQQNRVRVGRNTLVSALRLIPHAFGEVLGPMAWSALFTRGEWPHGAELPWWSAHVGPDWCRELLEEGSAILRTPPLLTESFRQVTRAVRPSREVDELTSIVDVVVRIAAKIRPVVDVRASSPGYRPKIDLILADPPLQPDEFRAFMEAVHKVPADVMVLPNPGSADLTAKPARG